MDRTELILAIAAVLFVAFLAGFLVSLAITRLSRVSRSEPGELDRMAEALQMAEEARDRAMVERTAAQNRLNHHMAQSDSDLRAAMEALSEARAEADELRRYVERQHRR